MAQDRNADFMSNIRRIAFAVLASHLFQKVMSFDSLAKYSIGAYRGSGQQKLVDFPFLKNESEEAYHGTRV